MDEGRRVHRSGSKRAGPDQRHWRRRLAVICARRKTTFPVRPSDVRHGEGRRIFVRAWTEGAGRHHRAKILTCLLSLEFTEMDIREREMKSSNTGRAVMSGWNWGKTVAVVALFGAKAPAAFAH